MGNKIYDKAIDWIHNNTVHNDGGIILSSSRRVLYPEVTGYYIPSLLHAEEKTLAVSFAKELCRLQKEDGSWFDSYDTAPYIFDSGQILKGLIAIREILPEVDDNIIKGVDWMLSNMNEEGRLVQPNQDAWGDDDYFCNDLIHLYTLSPIFDAAKIYNREDYSEKATKVLNYYIDNNLNRIEKFTLFAHFYAYVMEALVDCGKIELATKAMKNLERYVKKNGAIPGYPNISWVCSTAMFQFAITWYKLGQKEKADKTYEYACSLQNESGGWYGSYGINERESHLNSILAKFGLTKERTIYLPDEEISWAVKFYLDATYYKELSERH